MADLPISGLPPVTVPLPADEFGVNNDGISKKMTRQQVHSLEVGEVLVLPNGDDASNPELQFPNSGFYEDLNDELAISQGGVNVGNFTSAAAGGLFVNNTLTGAGLERVLTTSDNPTFGEYSGTFDASSGSFPSTTNQGDWFNCTVAGTVDSQPFVLGDILIATVDSPSTSIFAANWSLVPHVGQADHLLLANIGTNSHATIDSHIADSSIHFTDINDLADVDTSGFVTGSFIVREPTEWAVTVTTTLIAGIFRHAGEIRASTFDAYRLLDENPSTTNPVVCVRVSDFDTGFGSGAVDEISVICGGVEMMRFVESTADYILSQVPMLFAERAASVADIAGFGQVWVENLNPNILRFTDDSGSDFTVAQEERLNNFTVLQTFSATQAVAIANTLPLLSIQDTDAAADEGNWLWRVTAGDLIISTASDATPFTQGPQAMSFIRGTGNTFSNFQFGGPVLMAEVAAAVGDISAFGQYWVRNDVPNLPLFTDDAGTDQVIDPSLSEVNVQNGDYTLLITDKGKTISKESGGAGETFTIPANSSVAFAIGTFIGFNNDGGDTLTIAITTDTLIFADDNTTGSRTLGDGGMAVAEKITATSWKIAGAQLT